MKHTRKVIHIVKHIPTGAEVPVVINKINKNNVIEDYSEFTEKRKGFTVKMLIARWDKSYEDVIELLQEYQVPAHVRHTDVQALEPHQKPVDVAIFFQEYIYGIEKKTKMPHNKLKARSLDNQVEH